MAPSMYLVFQGTSTHYDGEMVCLTRLVTVKGSGKPVSRFIRMVWFL